MYTLIVENEQGEQLELTHNNNYDVLEVVGTNPPPAAINTVNIAGIDGSRFNSSRIEQRNLVISLNIKPPIEINRITLYKFIRVKRYIKVYYKNESRDVYIEGYVESFENNPWTPLQQPQISIICPEPFWLSTTETNISFSKTNKLFEFPFSIPAAGIEFSTIEKLSNTTFDAGGTATGAIIQFYATGNQITNPKFHNFTTGEFFGLNFEMQINDLITINTNQGKKSVTLLRDGVTTNILSSRMSGSSWLMFVPGENTIGYSSDSGQQNLNVSLTMTQKFEGV